jgi:pilus assembly protein CpaF
LSVEGDIVLMQEIFTFKREGMSPEGNILGKHVATGVRPKFAERAMEWGIDLPGALFGIPEQRRA